MVDTADINDAAADSGGTALSRRQIRICSGVAGAPETERLKGKASTWLQGPARAGRCALLMFE
jgi:hypothetical protein